MRLIALSCAWVLGIFLASRFHPPLALALTGLIPILLILPFKRLWKNLVLIAACLTILFSTGFYYSVNLSPGARLASFNNQGPIEIIGKIDVPPEERDTVIHIELSALQINGQNISGKVLIFAPRYPEYFYGDILTVKGKLENPPNFEGFDYQAYLAQNDIYSTMLNPSIKVEGHQESSRILGWIYSLREKLAQSLASALPEPQASLAQGIVLGIRTTIPDDLKNELSITGTAHLLAISGINLSIIAGILVALGIWVFGRRHYIYVWLSMACIWFYAVITGLQAPVIRSAIMASIFLLAELLGRQKHAFPALALSAAIMVGLEPQLLGSISFQLSFLAMVGLIFFSPTFQKLSRRAIYAVLGEEGVAVSIVSVITDSFSVTLSAVIAVWPVIAYNFGSVSLVGPVSTFLIAPALTPILVLGALTAFIGLFSTAIAQAAGWAAWLFLTYMLWLVKAFAGFSWAALQNIALSSALVWLYYLALGLIIWFQTSYKNLFQNLSLMPQFTREGAARFMDFFSRIPKKLIIVPLLVTACLITMAAVTLPDDDLHVSFLDVGEGDALLIQAAHQNILIDGGPSPQSVSLGLSQKLPFWDRQLDLVILTHPHADHLNGLIEVLQRYQVKQVLAPNLASTSPAYQEWLNLIQNRGIPYSLAQADQSFKLQNGSILEILNPPDISPVEKESAQESNGIVSRLVWNQVSFLFTADINPETEDRLLMQRADIACTVLKVAHHGSGNSTTASFLSVAQPQIAVISVGSDNTFGHPDEDLLKRLQAASVYRTDLSGTIELTTDGESLWIKKER